MPIAICFFETRQERGRLAVRAMKLVGLHFHRSLTLRARRSHFLVDDVVVTANFDRDMLGFQVDRFSVVESAESLLRLRS